MWEITLARKAAAGGTLTLCSDVGRVQMCLSGLQGRNIPLPHTQGLTCMHWLLGTVEPETLESASGLGLNYVSRGLGVSIAQG